MSRRWIEKRRYTERVLERAGLLGNQRLFTKTYPTNSGEGPEGLEELAWKQLGRNAMSTNLAASLMLALQSGAIEPQATHYMRSLLRRPTFSDQGSLGTGLPPGSLQQNKAGVAFDTLEDIMYAELPNGRRLIVAALSNGWDQKEPQPWDIARLGQLTELLVERLDLAQGLPRPRYLQPTRSADGSFSWSLDAPDEGEYEIAAWYAANAARTPAALYSIDDADDGVNVQLDQRAWGARWIKLGDFGLQRGAREGHAVRHRPGQPRRWPAARHAVVEKGPDRFRRDASPTDTLSGGACRRAPMWVARQRRRTCRWRCGPARVSPCE